MGKMSTGLKRIFDQAVQEKVVSLDAMKAAKQQASHNLETMPSVENLVVSGHDPQHAIYVNTLNLISLFGEEMSTLPPLHRINDFLAKWQDVYQPSFPPISPITTSYFTCWSMLDATFGVDKETVGTCFLSLIDRLHLDPVQIEAARNLDQSRMGIYQVLQGNSLAKPKDCRACSLLSHQHLPAPRCSRRTARIPLKTSHVPSISAVHSRKRHSHGQQPQH